MAKAINWPTQFRDEVINEDCDKEYCAFRIGTLYYDNQFWVPDEVVDIRVNHLKVRQATVTREVKACAIKDLSTEDLNAQKQSLQTPEKIVAFLSSNYDKPLTEDDTVTVVYYKNHPINPEEMEASDNPNDPHM